MTEQKKIAGLYILIFCLLRFSSPAQELLTKNTYVIVVGISAYQDAAMPRLQYADKDATLFSQWLQTKAAGAVPEYNIKLLTNENATVAAFYNALDWAKQKTKENDLVYIYFSGHGDVETKNNNSQGYLLAWNSPSNNYLNNAISVNDLNNTAEELTTKNKAKIVIITDACHSGKMAGDYYKGRQLTATNLQLVLNNQVRMASCKTDEEAAEGIGWGGGRGVFSYYLLQGLEGSAKENDLVRLDNLQQYLDSSFAADLQLKQSKHIQNPVSNGNPVFTLAKIEPAKILVGASLVKQKSPVLFSSAPGLQSLRSVGPQPMDYFFALANQDDFENSLPFDGYLKYTADTIPIKIVEEYCAFLKKGVDVQDKAYIKDSLLSDSILKKQLADDLQFATPNDNARLFKENHADDIARAIKIKAQQHDTLNHLLILLDQLKNNNYSRERFAEKFVQVVHNQSQDMINAYLKGDEAELEKRQYYATGKRDYRNFLPLLQIAISLAPENNYLKSILQVNETYLDGLIDRLAIATNANGADSLTKTATEKIQRAMQLEPYSAYIHNEMGNILFQKKMYDSALYHFNYATILAPSWAIPYSNKIRVGLATNDLPEAILAAHTADSLQPNLAFVNINAGLVMEKTGDLLAAESYYLKAIKENNVHYLPYERLGDIYLRTGDYASADFNLYEAKIRKELFAVNPDPFKYGVAMSPGPESLDEPYEFSCIYRFDKLFTNWQTKNELIAAVNNIRSGDSAKLNSGKVVLTKLLAKNPDFIYANHYLGKQKFNDGDVDAAEKLFKKAIANYQVRGTLKNNLKKSIIVGLQQNKVLKDSSDFDKSIDTISQSLDSSCFLNSLLALDYEEVEDHYMLASIYQKKNNTTEEIKEYKIISGIENKNQDEQAGLAGAYKDTKNEIENKQNFFHYLLENGLNENQYHNKYFQVNTVGSVVKLARLLEKEGDFYGAEKELLAQVARNQAAGLLRQKKMEESKVTWRTKQELNNYWRDLNENLEIETFYFYKRMIAIFPRDEYWFKNAGLFLYNRLLLSFPQIAPADRKEFYTNSSQQYYPFKLNMVGYKSFSEVLIHDFFIEKKEISIPGTNETIEFDSNPYDPVYNANIYLQQALKFSGDSLPNPTLTEYIADLQNWMGLNDSAILNYQYALKYSPKNKDLLTKLSDVLRIEDRKPEIVENFEILHTENKLTTEESFELADYYILQQKYNDAEILLSKIPANTSSYQLQQYLAKIKIYVLQKQFSKALPLVNAALEEPDLSLDVQENLYYNKTRIEAFTKNYSAAIKTLKEFFPNGYNLFYVLSQDELLTKLRKKRRWKNYVKSHPFINIYDNKDADPIQVSSPLLK